MSAFLSVCLSVYAYVNISKCLSVNPSAFGVSVTKEKSFIVMTPTGSFIEFAEV